LFPEFGDFLLKCRPIGFGVFPVPLHNQGAKIGVFVPGLLGLNGRTGSLGAIHPQNQGR
jgi:hypothetical protein